MKQGLKCHLHIFKKNRSSPYILEFMGCKKCMYAYKNTTRGAYDNIDQINQNGNELGFVWGWPVKPVQEAGQTGLSQTANKKLQYINRFASHDHNIT